MLREGGRIPAYKNCGEEVKDAVYPRDDEDAVKEARLPWFGKQSQEEETKRDLEESRGENIEDFTQLDVLVLLSVVVRRNRFVSLQRGSAILGPQ